MSDVDITSLTNDRVKFLVRLQAQSRVRRREGLFCVESEREYLRAVEAGFEVDQFYFCRDVMSDNDLEGLLGAVKGVAPLSVSETVLAKISYRQNPQGFLGVFRVPGRGGEEIQWPDDALVLICSGLEKPGNIGAIARTAEAAGVTAMFIDSAEFDVFSPHAIRVSTGAVFSLPIVGMDAEGIRRIMVEKGISMIALSPDGDVGYTDLELRHSTALILGAESSGLSEEWRSSATVLAAIATGGKVDSLNVSVSAAVVLFEARRQRGTGGR